MNFITFYAGLCYFACFDIEFHFFVLFCFFNDE